MRIVDDAGQPVPTGEVGEIEARSAWLMSEYLRRQDLTEGAFSADGFLRMGDLAKQDEESFVYIVGRKKDMIVTGGENVYPKEVEDVITGFDLVDEVAVVGVPDPVYEERVVAVVRLSETAPKGSVTADDIVAGVRGTLAGYKAPRSVVFVDDFPRNAMGKVDKVALRQAYAGIAQN
jgi:acyl-CoA synthetase (AMP-forming)/AMP-acid ligase II